MAYLLTSVYKNIFYKKRMIPRMRLSPFPRVESRFNTHNQNAFANAFRNAFLELLRLSSISQNHDYEYTVRPRKTYP